jgi:pullulanase-type alpha-1,6-glucosidase
LSSATGTIAIKSDGTITGADSTVDLGAPGALPGTVTGKFPQLSGTIAFTVPTATVQNIKSLLTTQLVVVDLNGSSVVKATHLQLQGVIDDTYGAAAQTAALGVTFANAVPTYALWAPTAQSVSLLLNGTTVAMTEDPNTGIWSYTGDSTQQNTANYNFVVKVYARTDGETVKTYTVTDPYSTGLDAYSSSGTPNQHSVAIDLSSAATYPSDWAGQASQKVAAAADVVLYELHVRDFSANDTSVPAEDRGKFLAFSHPTSTGMTHLQNLALSGITHVHLLPAFDIASVPDTGCTTPSISNSSTTSQAPQSAVAATASTDCFNWGYDPRTFGVPTGAYSTDGSAMERVRNFREMVVGLHNAGLGVVMDVVYNHMSTNFLDKVVPGYYYRLDANGNITNTSCCSDTATEFVMVEKLMNDTLARWTSAYLVDGFRFDVMQNIPLAAMNDARAAVTAAANGRFIYIYGEGFQNTENFVQAEIGHLGNSHIGAFNYFIRDAVRGGGPFDSGNALTTNQGFMSGLCYDGNASVGTTCASNTQASLFSAQNAIRVSMAGAVPGVAGQSGIQFDGSTVAFATNPDETVNYIACHDGQTLWDIGQYKHPSTTSSADRARAHVVGLSTVLLGQGVPFIMAGDEILRSKAFDQNSYDSGDWFNRIDWTMTSNYINDGNLTMGLPPSGPNGSNWSVMSPFLQNPNVNPTPVDISLTNSMVSTLLQIRRSTSLFRLRNASDITNCVSFPDAASQKQGLIVMRLDTTGADGRVCGDKVYSHIVVMVNANKVAQSYQIPAFASTGFTLHPAQAAGADTVALGSTYDSTTGTFTVPARTTAVFVQ